MIDFIDAPVCDLNIGRPNLMDEEYFVAWEKVHDFIKQSDMRICVNGAFHVMDQYIANRQGYMGGGFEYRFWFESEDDKAHFSEFVNGVFDDLNKR